jgi:hypothetical protein
MSRELKPAVTAEASRPAWQRQPAALMTVLVGFAALVIAAVMVLRAGTLFENIPDLRITVPLWIATAVSGAVSLMRRERNPALVVAGVAMASAALALGWVLVLAAVAAGALLIIYVMSELF